MEGKYLVASDDKTFSTNSYGTVNPAHEDSKSMSLECKANKSSGNEKSSKLCSCSMGQSCECGKPKRKVLLEPWARYKSITLAVGLSIFGVWLVVIAIIANQGKL
ncbi:uncharacterized protein LOC129960464 isoform X1 [Argiope bruennichi]|uniref:uncharacterized protein LOC129960464 isoform X1 n=1 Tax=Argiope bruennichi TaxID=94029 RepID=UPI0024949257|nr:uncharacterized protein LOC129960464 isoform X1 [Argiope bruennichi]